MDTEEFIDIQPWPVAELAGQAIAHMSLGRRGMIELDLEADVFERETDRFELEAWARMELIAWLDEQQFCILEAPVGNLNEQQVADSQESLIIGSTIGWALRLVNTDHLSLQAQGDEEIRMLTWVPTPWTPVRSVLKSLRCRSDESLAAERERWELIHWRCTLFAAESDRAEDQAALKETVAEVREMGILATKGDDFALETGEAFSDLSLEELSALESVAETRLRTLNWVCGFGESPTAAPLYLDDDED